MDKLIRPISELEIIEDKIDEIIEKLNEIEAKING